KAMAVTAPVCPSRVRRSGSGGGGSSGPPAGPRGGRGPPGRARGRGGGGGAADQRRRAQQGSGRPGRPVPTRQSTLGEEQERDRQRPGQGGRAQNEAADPPAAHPETGDHSAHT